MAEEHVPSADILARRRYIGSAAAQRGTVALSTVTAKTGALTAGLLYMVTADVPWFFNHGAQASVTATSGNFLLGAYSIVEVWVMDTNTNGIAGILASGTGTLYYQAIS